MYLIFFCTYCSVHFPFDQNHHVTVASVLTHSMDGAGIFWLDRRKRGFRG